MFTEGRNLSEDEQRSGRPSATVTDDTTAWVRELLRFDRRLTVKMVADEVNMNQETVRLILTEESGMKKFVPRWCPEISKRNSALRG